MDLVRCFEKFAMAEITVKKDNWTAETQSWLSVTTFLICVWYKKGKIQIRKPKKAIHYVQEVFPHKQSAKAET